MQVLLGLTCSGSSSGFCSTTWSASFHLHIQAILLATDLRTHDNFIRNLRSEHLDGTETSSLAYSVLKKLY